MKYKLITKESMPSSAVKESVLKLSEDKIRVTFFSLMVFIAGFSSKQVVNLVGEIYVTELLLPILAVIVLLFGKTPVFREKVFWQFVALGVCLMLGYIVSDLVAGTDSTKYYRAWGRNLILFLDFISLAIIVGSDRRLIWWFALGLAAGSLFFLIYGHASIMYQWKFGYAQPITLLVLLFCYFLPFKFSALALVALSIISIYMDSRSSSAFSMFVAGVLLLRIKKPDGYKLNILVLFKISIIAIILITLLMVLMSKTQDEFSDRREASSSGRFVALRIGVTAVLDSPVLGHGSWGQGTEEYASMVYKEMFKTMAELDRKLHKADIFRPHSQVLQSWMEGGFFAATFFLFFGYQLVVRLKDVVLVRRLDYLTPLFSFFLLVSIWHLIMSPYGGGHRLAIAISIAIICLLHIEARGKKKALNMLVHKQD